MVWATIQHKDTWVLLLFITKYNTIETLERKIWIYSNPKIHPWKIFIKFSLSQTRLNSVEFGKNNEIIIIIIWTRSSEQVVYVQPRIHPGEWDAQSYQGFDIQIDHQILTRWPDLVIVNQKKKNRTYRIMDFAILAHHRVKLKESEKRDKYLNLARELKKLWNMKVMVIPVVMGMLWTILKG